MTKIQNEKEALQMICPEEDILHQAYLKPFVPQCNPSLVIATDGRMMFLVDKSLTSGKYAAQKIRIPEWSNHKLGRVVPFANIEAAYNRFVLTPEMKPVDGEDDECPECCGTGTVEFEYTCDTDGRTHYHEDDCPICEGTGKREVEYVPTGRWLLPEKGLFRLGDVTFKAELLWKAVEALRLMGFEQMTWQTANADGVNLFDVAEGIQFVIMPFCIPQGETSVVIEEVEL